MPIPESVRARLATWHAATLGLLLSALALAGYLHTASSTLRRTDEYLRAGAGTFADVLREEHVETGNPAEAAQETMMEIRFGTLRVVVLDSALRPLAVSAPPAPGERRGPGRPLDVRRLAAALRGVPGGGPSLFTLGSDEGGSRVFVQRILLGNEAVTLAVGQSLHERQEALESARTIFLVSIPLVLLMAWVSGYALARRSLAPVVAMGERAARLGAGDLDVLLPVQNARDELGRLALSFNDLLRRLHQAMELQRSFMADAGHELRTPVSILRGEADLALSEVRRTPEEYREALSVMSAEARRLGGIVEDIFLLARADAGQQPLRAGELYLDELAAACTRNVRSLAVRRGVGVTFSAEGDFPFRGDEPLLHRMLLNLLDNALKYTSRHGRVGVDLLRLAEGYAIRVWDTAPQIDPAVAERIFERFYRVDRARARTEGSTAGGTGLGLPIARWVAEAHGGSLRLAGSGPEGNEFVVILPYVHASRDPGEARV